MKSKRIVIVAALSFSFLFSMFYLLVFQYYNPIEDVQTTFLYMNQIGLYKEEANATKVKSSLEANDVTTYIYKDNELYVVVCGLGSKDEAEMIGNKLKELSYSYILKKIEIIDQEINSYVEAKDYEKALELIGNQSQGNATK